MNDLTQIKGIGEKVAEKLAAEGVADLKTLANLTDEDIGALDARLGLKGHAVSQDWRGQARALIDGKSQPPSDDVLAEAMREIREMRAKLAALEPNGGVVATPKVAVSDEGRAPRRRRLNRFLDFGTVFGSAGGATYVQERDGEEVFFNHSDLEIFEGEGANDAKESEAEPPFVARDSRDFNAINYLDGKAHYDFEFVQRALKLNYGQTVTNERSAKAVLHRLMRHNA